MIQAGNGSKVKPVRLPAEVLRAAEATIEQPYDFHLGT
jgi:hypothetical protein